MMNRREFLRTGAMGIGALVVGANSAQAQSKNISEEFYRTLDAYKGLFGGPGHDAISVNDMKGGSGVYNKAVRYGYEVKDNELIMGKEPLELEVGNVIIGDSNLDGKVDYYMTSYDGPKVNVKNLPASERDRIQKTYEEGLRELLQVIRKKADEAFGTKVQKLK